MEKSAGSLRLRRDAAVACRGQPRNKKRGADLAWSAPLLLFCHQRPHLPGPLGRRYVRFWINRKPFYDPPLNTADNGCRIVVFLFGVHDAL